MSGRRIETYRASRRNGWKVANKAMRDEAPGTPRIPWEDFNKAVTDEMRQQGYYSAKDRRAKSKRLKDAIDAHKVRAL